MDMDTARAKLNTGNDTLKLRQHCQSRRAAMIETRDQEIPDWMQVSQFIDPSRGRFSDMPSLNNDGGTRQRRRSRAKIINNKATYALRVAVAGLSSYMTSKSRPWFKLVTPYPEMNELFSVRVWLDQVTQLLRDTLAGSNFYKQIPVGYTEDMMFGLMSLLIVQDDEEVVRFHTLTAGTHAISIDADGRVDALWRCYPRTLRQLSEKYGEENLPAQFRKRLKENGGGDVRVNVESLIEKNPDALPGMGALGLQAVKYRPWREVVWVLGSDNDKHGVLNIGGHYEQPFIAVRFNPVADDTYSTCPGIDSLGDIKQLQYLEGKKLKLIDLMAEPPLGLPDTMKAIGSSLSPGTKTYLPQSQNGAKAEPLYVPDANALTAVNAEIREVESRILDSFFYNLFMMMEALGDQVGRTAFEIAQRRDEKAGVLGPTVESISGEGLDLIVIRVFRLLERAGRLPPTPDALRNVPLKIEYTSILAQAMKAEGVISIERTAAFVANMASVYGPQVLDKFDSDQATDEFADRVGTPASLIRDDDTVAAMRASRQQQEQRAQLMAAAKPIADAATAVKTLDEAVPQEGSLGEGLIERMTGGSAQ